MKKTCRKCGYVGMSTEFSADRDWCKPCRNKASRRYYLDRRTIVMPYTGPRVEKTCSVCKASKPIGDFYTGRGECQACTIAKVSERYWADPEPKREYQRSVSAQSNERARARYAADSISKKASVKRWQDANPDKVKERQHRRRARELEAPTIPFTPSQLRERLSVYDGVCWICKTRAGPEIDHVKPLSKGGWHCLANLRPICVPCNRRKSDKWPFRTGASLPS
jgi:5-methylcytosine-specific restriction endonuclease McrA